jgi:transposase
MINVTELVGLVFSGLSPVVIEDVTDGGDVIVVRARTRDAAAACPHCGTAATRVHGYHDRTAADVPVGGRRVLIRVRARRMRCVVTDCPRQTFREQVPGVPDRYQRRTARLNGQVSAVARELAGRPSARLLPVLGISASRHTMVRVLLAIPLPATAVPRVLGIDDFALRRSSVYATVLIDAETGRRADVIPGRTADAAQRWLRGHHGIEVVCRDGSGAHGEAIRRALPGAVQVSDRWHLWHPLAEAVRQEVAAHCGCWARGSPLQDGPRAATTAERWQQVHELRSRNVGLPGCARRLNLSLNTVKRDDRASEPQRLQRVPKYSPTLAGPHHDYLRKRRAQDPAVQPTQLLREIRELGYPGSMNLLFRYTSQGRPGSDRPHLSPRRAARILLTRPDRLTGSQAETRARLERARPEMTALTALTGSFARMLAPAPKNAAALQRWAAAVREADLPHLHSFTRGPGNGPPGRHSRAHAAVSHGRTEGASTKTKMIKRQMYGRAGFTLLRHRILLG